MSDDGGGRIKGVSASAGENYSPAPPPNYYYGTFQGVANYQSQPPPPSHPVMGFPQPVPPSAFSGSPPHYYPQGYQAIPVPGRLNIEVAKFAILEYLGLNYCLRKKQSLIPFLFFNCGYEPLIFFFFYSLCNYVAEGRPFREDRLPCCGIGIGWFLEKAGLIACTLGALLASIAVTLGVTRAAHSR